MCVKRLCLIQENETKGSWLTGGAVWRGKGDKVNFFFPFQPHAIGPNLVHDQYMSIGMGDGGHPDHAPTEY